MPEETSEDRKIKYIERYDAAAHAVQTGVAFELSRGDDDGAASPKHLRTGLNLSKAEMAGLVRLLVRKGVFTDEEYFEAMANAAEEEVKFYEARIKKLYGLEVTLR